MSGKWTWEPLKHVDPEATTCACGRPATVCGECGACFAASEAQADRVAAAERVVYRLGR